MEMNGNLSTYQARRQAFIEQMGAQAGNGVAIFPAAPSSIRSQDVEYRYRQDNDLYYLTGFPEPESLCLLSPQHEKEQFILFVRPRDKEKETWTGKRFGIEGAAEYFGVDAAYSIDQLDEVLPEHLLQVEKVYYGLGRDERLNTKILDFVNHARQQRPRSGQGPVALIDPSDILHELRLFKNPEEIALMRQAVIASAAAHQAALQETRPDMYEYEIEALLEFHFRRNGAEGPAYPSIVASGANATILHYITNDQQKQAIKMIRPGVRFDDVHQLATEILIDGLRDLGILSGSRESILEKGDYRRFYMHSTSHWLGMDVHDVGKYKIGVESRELEPSMVLTVEPGLYIAEDAEVPEAYQGIGVRIEDDVLVTPDGYEVLTAAILKEVDDIEAARGGG